MRVRVMGVVALVALLVIGAGSAEAKKSAPPPPPPLAIHVISDRADVISAGDALISIDLPAAVDPATVRVTDNGRDVTGQFAKRSNGLYEGLLTGLDLGPNLVVASAPGATSDQITITN